MSDAPPAVGKAAAKAGSKGKKASKKPAAAAEPEGPRPPFKPAKMTHYDRQVGAGPSQTARCSRQWLCPRVFGRGIGLLPAALAALGRKHSHALRHVAGSPRLAACRDANAC